MPKKCNHCGKPANKSCGNCSEVFCNAHFPGHFCSEIVKKVEKLESVMLKEVQNVRPQTTTNTMNDKPELYQMMMVMKYGPILGRGLLDFIMLMSLSDLRVFNIFGYISFKFAILNNYFKSKQELFGGIFFVMITICKYVFFWNINFLVVLFIQYCLIYKYSKSSEQNVNLPASKLPSVLMLMSRSSSIKSKIEKTLLMGLDVFNCFVVPKVIDFEIISAVNIGIGLMALSLKNYI